jgi:ADP-heptose:LPS heptosyltransferase
MSKEWLLVVLSFLYAPFRKGAKTLHGTPERVVIVQMAKLGDMVCTTPLFRAVKAQYPSCELVVVGNKVNRELLEGNKDVDRYVEFAGILPTIRALRGARIDFGCITSPSAPLLAVLYLSGVRLIAAPLIEGGRSPNDTRAYRMLARLCATRPHQMRHYAPREYLRLLEPIAIHTENTEKHLSYTERAGESIATYLREQNLRTPGRMLLGVAPSAGHKTKEWFPERFAEVITRLRAEYPLDVVLIGSTGDMKTAEAVKAQLSQPVIDTCGMFGLDDAKALIASLDLLLSVDTGPVYVAEAFGVPTVDITGPIDEHEQPPIGDTHLVVVPSGKREPQLFVMNAREYDLAKVREQLDSITVEMVLDSCRTLIERLRSPGTTHTPV